MVSSKGRPPSASFSGMPRSPLYYDRPGAGQARREGQNRKPQGRIPVRRGDRHLQAGAIGGGNRNLRAQAHEIGSTNVRDPRRRLDCKSSEGPSSRLRNGCPSCSCLSLFLWWIKKTLPPCGVALNFAILTGRVSLPMSVPVTSRCDDEHPKSEARSKANLSRGGSRIARASEFSRPWHSSGARGGSAVAGRTGLSHRRRPNDKDQVTGSGSFQGN